MRHNPQSKQKESGIRLALRCFLACPENNAGFYRDQREIYFNNVARAVILFDHLVQGTVIF